MEAAAAVTRRDGRVTQPAATTAPRRARRLGADPRPAADMGPAEARGAGAGAGTATSALGRCLPVRSPWPLPSGGVDDEAGTCPCTHSISS